MESGASVDALLALSKGDSEGSRSIEKDDTGLGSPPDTVTPTQEEDASSKVPSSAPPPPPPPTPPPQEEEDSSEEEAESSQPPQPKIFRWLGPFLDATPERAAEESLAEFHKKKYVCEVEQASMRDWRKPSWHNLRWPMPIIQAFYVQKPGGPKGSPSELASYKDRRESPSEENEASENLQRVIIYSDILYEELLRITSISSALFPITLNPPYKLILHFLPDIKARIMRLEEELDGFASETALLSTEDNSERPSACEEKSSPGHVTEGSTSEHEQDDGTGSNKDDTSSVASVADQRESIEAQHLQLKCLYDFVAHELKEEIQLRERVKMGTLLKIRFQDLWHLYQMGDMVYSKSRGRDQLYKVFAVTGGQIPGRKIEDPLASYNPPPPAPPDYEEVFELHEETLEKEQYSGVGVRTTFKVDCYKMAFDGVFCGPVSVLKLQFHPDRDLMMRKAEERGRKVLFGGGHKSYDGENVVLKLEDRHQQIASDVYVDFHTYFQDYPVYKPIFGTFFRSKQNPREVEEDWPGVTSHRVYSGHEVDVKRHEDFMAASRAKLERFKPDEKSVSGDYLVLFPPWVFGYIFQTRRWSRLDIELVNEMDRESDGARRAGFDDLVIDQRNRDLLVALVDNHASGLQRAQEKTKQSKNSFKPTQIDLVRGKGQGLIILLHGPPGSGKTSTAETIAAYTGRPLYAITCGDIGTTPEEVETRLLQHTQRADKWGCVLLLDEADVFLVQRDWRSIERNALVSVFLRQLEYYAGILFLTTNRPGVLDEAFKSRIHISLRYPSIDLESTKTMWRNIMNRLEADNKSASIKIVFDKQALLEFAQRHFDRCSQAGVTWNGRQIRNAFQTAIALGHYERVAKIRAEGMTPEEALATGKKKWNTVKLTKANFQKIARTASDFEEYIEKLRGNDSMTARELELRDDDYDPHTPRARKQYTNAATLRDDARLAPRKDRLHSSKSKRPVREEHSVTEDDEEDDASEDLSLDSNEDD